ncbi:MAG: hypothetical protein U0Q16_23515 [Bryobacteraceae bacterium]
MPGEYTVRNRAVAERTFGGLGLPIPPAQGRLMVPLREQGLRYVPMAASPTCGDARTFANAGLWTDGISDCCVIAIAQYDQNSWTKFCFHHMQGGMSKYTLQDFAMKAPIPARCWAVVADKSGLTDTLIDELAGWGIPRAQISRYVSRGDFTFGLRFFGGAFGEIKFPYG